MNAGDPRRCPFVRAVATGDDDERDRLYAADPPAPEPAVRALLERWALRAWETGRYPEGLLPPPRPS